MSQDYEITRFRPEHLPGVLDVLGALWTWGRDTREKLFRWKYVENPNSDEPLGIVALHGGQVAGFRGYFANRYGTVPGGRDFVILHPGDTCVDPAHRNRNLSVAMGNLAKQYDRTRYRIFMNMTSSANSLPGYLKMGFVPLASKVHLTRHGANPLDWLRSRQAQQPRPLTDSRIRFGRFGDVLVTDSPLPAEMASVAEHRRPGAPVLRPRQDQAFFAWRYRNPVQKYVFHFLMDRDSVRGYVAMGVSPNNRIGEILDYGDRGDGAVDGILHHVVRSGAFLRLKVRRYGVDERLAAAVRTLGFDIDPPWRRILGRRLGESAALPLLIRPIADACAEDDWFIDGLDVRRIENWRLKPICSDAD
jgi:GNAT superfamily N-acetyltransferase